MLAARQVGRQGCPRRIVPWIGVGRAMARCPRPLRGAGNGLHTQMSPGFVESDFQLPAQHKPAPESVPEATAKLVHSSPPGERIRPGLRISTQRRGTGGLPV